MKRNAEEIWKEGEEIAQKLGNGVKYLAPQIINGELIYHLFNDDVTRATFVAGNIEEAKEKLVEKRRLCNAPSPSF